MKFSTKDFANLNERVGWLTLLLPIYDPGEHCIESLATGIAIGFQYVADEPENYVTTTTLTVEADGEGPFHVDEEDMAWLTLYSCDRFEFDGADGFELAPAGAVLDYRLFRMPLGEAHVSPPEVTL